LDVSHAKGGRTMQRCRAAGAVGVVVVALLAAVPVSASITGNGCCYTIVNSDSNSWITTHPIPDEYPECPIYHIREWVVTPWGEGDDSCAPDELIPCGFCGHSHVYRVKCGQFQGSCIIDQCGCGQVDYHNGGVWICHKACGCGCLNGVPPLEHE
jgi:hypothetical protein